MDKIRDLRNKFFQINDEYLNGYAKLCGINATGVYLSMCRHANKQQTCFPSKKLIAEELAISERSVYTAIKKLAEWHIIKIERQGRKIDGSFKNLLYTLLDKTQWQEKPSANGAVGKKRHSPSANDDITRRQQVPNKETHINHTHNNQTHSVDTPSQIFKKFLSYSYQEKKILLKEKLNRNLEIEEEKEIEHFVDYWTEPNKSGTKQRWELERTFDLIRRVKTWFNNINKFNKQNYGKNQPRQQSNKFAKLTKQIS